MLVSRLWTSIAFLVGALKGVNAAGSSGGYQDREDVKAIQVRH